MEIMMEMRRIEYGSQDYETTLDLRNEIFRKPQGLNLRDEDLSREALCDMFGGFIGEKIIATIFLTKIDDLTARIKAVMILEEYRGTGLGKFIMNYAEEVARNQGYKYIKLLSRMSAETFYEKLGYQRVSEPLDYFQVAHVSMVKEL